MIFCTARNQIIAVDPENGTEIWRNSEVDTKEKADNIAIGATKYTILLMYKYYILRTNTNKININIVYVFLIYADIFFILFSY